jgi:hypothetical protein
MRERKSALCVWACIPAEQRRLKESRRRPLRTVGNEYLPHRMSGDQCVDCVRNRRAHLDAISGYSARESRRDNALCGIALLCRGRSLSMPQSIAVSSLPPNENGWPCVRPRRKKAE